MRLRQLNAAIIFTMLAAGPALAQGSDRGFVRGLGGVSFAGETSAIYGGGGGFRVGRNLTITGEVGRIQNVIPQDFVDQLALAEDLIEGEFGLPITLEASIPALYFIGGIRADIPTSGRLKPFVEASAGVARLNLNVHAEFSGIDVSDELNDVLEDEELSEFMLAIGGGVTMQVSGSCWIDAGYRYHRINTDDPVSNTSAVYAALRFAFK